jgi:hypothetical protein
MMLAMSDPHPVHANGTWAFTIRRQTDSRGADLSGNTAKGDDAMSIAIPVRTWNCIVNFRADAPK